MSIDISPKLAPTGRYVVELAHSNGTVVHVDVMDVADMQQRLTAALVEAQRQECEQKLSSAGVVFVAPTTSLRWTREGTGSHAYSAMAPGGVMLRVRLHDYKWQAIVGDAVIGEFEKKRQAQVLCEQHLTSNGNVQVSFMGAK